MNLILRKSPLQVHIVLLLGCLLVARPAIAQSNDIAEGRKQYLQHCAACHGIKGDGHGPLEHELKDPPADLRLLSRRYGNPLPEDQIARFIDGRADVKLMALVTCRFGEGGVAVSRGEWKPESGERQRRPNNPLPSVNSNCRFTRLAGRKRIRTCNFQLTTSDQRASLPEGR